MLGLALSAAGFLGDWWDLIAGGLGLASLGAGFVLPKWWKVAAIAAVVAVVGIYVGVLKLREADLRVDLATSSAALVSTALERDQAATAAESTARSLAELKRQKAAELAALDRRRLAAEAAIVQRDKILEEVRNAKDARDALPDALRPFLERVR